MAENVLNRIIRQEIHSDQLIQSLIRYENEDDFFNEFSCTKEEFVSFFLNFIHEELVNNHNHNDSCLDVNSANCSTPKVTRTNVDLSYTSPISPLYKTNSFTTPKNSKSLTLGDFLVTRKSSNRKRNSEPRKRIKPVNVNDAKSTTFHKSENSFDFNKCDFEEMPIERESLLEEKMRVCSETKNVKVPRTLLRHSSEELIPDVRHVSFQNEMTLLVDIYTCLLDNNYVIDLHSEIVFLVNFLVKRRLYDELGVEILNNSMTLQNLFKNHHNQFFFIANALARQSRVLRLYDSSTVKLLQTNERLVNFAPKLLHQLESTPVQSSLFENSLPQKFVNFNSDTDNRNNFPTEISFHAFRKQRDLFYEISRQWELYQANSDFDFAQSLGGKIKCLLHLSDEPINFMHLARLFKAHFLNNSTEGDNKLSRLQNRCVTKGAVDDFDQSEAFYRNFVVVGDSWRFNKHLIDVLIEEIVEINANSFDLVTKKTYFVCVKQLRQLAKFLVFVETLPYNSDHKYDEHIQGAQIKVRKEVSPNFDIKSYLDSAICQNTVILTLPWLVVYLSELDHVTLCLTYYKEILGTLDWLHNNFQSSRDVNMYLCKLLIGWLFELSHIPIVHCRQKPEVKRSVGLDDSDIVEPQVLYLCCSHLSEVKKLLTTNLTTNMGTVKHITPVSALSKPQDVARRKIECQLEEAFLNGQPVSLRKTIEFVSERVASSCVKHLCHTFIPSEKKKERLEFQKMITNDDQMTMKSKANDFALICLNKLKKQCTIEIQKISTEKIDNAIGALVALDTLEQTKIVTIAITKKQCLERINQWIDNHVTLTIFTKDFYDEIQKIEVRKPCCMLPPGGSKKRHSNDVTSAAHLLAKLRMTTIFVIENKRIGEEVIPILAETLTTITERCDINENAIATLCIQVLDLTLLLLASESRSIVFQDDIFLNKCNDIWRCYHSTSDDLFKNLLCARNVKFLTVSKGRKESWNAMAQFCAYLIRMELMEWSNFEGQCMGIFRFEWDEGTLVDITGFFKTFVRFYRNQGGDAFLLDFLADYCDDLF